ncbi:hypothetical protein [Paractinoplanes maris]|uniref:hypothetical protein n=1 Tax=Paractinoplanes maris TaxID=1734446 RepID=UPI00202174D8|nr:hypothetical protein [Actinoplanes maris]
MDTEARRRTPRPSLLNRVLGAVLVPAGIGLATEVVGGLVPQMTGHETAVWSVLTGLVLLGVAVVVLDEWHAGPRRRRPGKRVHAFSAADLEVHEAVEVPGVPVASQPVYVRREHDRRLTEVVDQVAAGRSKLVTLVGDSSTGKTRAFHESIQGLPKKWHLWHPIDPSRPDALLESLADVRPCTVVWINDAHHYLSTPDPALGEQVAARLRTLLSDERRGPVLVLATLWPQFWQRLTAAPQDGRPDPHDQARALLRGSEVVVPEAFAGADLEAIRAAGERDERLAVAVREAAGGRIAQFLAGVPELLRRYRTAPAGQRAVLEAAIDARRMGHPVYLPGAFLERAAAGYLSATDLTSLVRKHGADWFHAVLDDLDQPQRGIPGPLTRVRPGDDATVRLADAIEQAGTAARAAAYPPPAFWEAATTVIDVASVLAALGDAAAGRGRFGRAAQLYRRAAGRGEVRALTPLARIHLEAGEDHAAEEFARAAANRGDAAVLLSIAVRRAADGDLVAAESLAWEAARSEDLAAWDLLADIAARRGDRDSAATYAGHAAKAYPPSMLRLARMRRQAGDRDGAEELYRRAVECGHLPAYRHLADLRHEAGDHDSAAQLENRAGVLPLVAPEKRHLLSHRHPYVDVERCWRIFERAAGDEDHLARHIFRDEHWSPPKPSDGRGGLSQAIGLIRGRRSRTAPPGEPAAQPDALAEMHAGLRDLVTSPRRLGGGILGSRLDRLTREAAARAGRTMSAESVPPREMADLAREQAGRGDPDAAWLLGLVLELRAEPDEAARMYRVAADAGDKQALRALVSLTQWIDGVEAAELLAVEAVNRGDIEALETLASLRESFALRNRTTRSSSVLFPSSESVAWPAAAASANIAERLVEGEPADTEALVEWSCTVLPQMNREGDEWDQTGVLTDEVAGRREAALIRRFGLTDDGKPALSLTPARTDDILAAKSPK